MTGHEQAEALRAAGWRVLEGDKVFKVLAPGEHPQHGWESIAANPDGTMHLVVERAESHRRAAAVLNGL